MSNSSDTSPNDVASVQIGAVTLPDSVQTIEEYAFCECTLLRTIDIPKNVKKVALIMSSGSAYVYGPAIAQYYQSIVEYWGVKNAGIFTANGEKNKSEEKRQELYAFGKALKKENAQ